MPMFGPKILEIAGGSSIRRLFSTLSFFKRKLLKKLRNGKWSYLVSAWKIRCA